MSVKKIKIKIKVKVISVSKVKAKDMSSACCITVKWNLSLKTPLIHRIITYNEVFCNYSLHYPGISDLENFAWRYTFQTGEALMSC